MDISKSSKKNKKRNVGESMKIKYFKKEIMNESYNIPDVYEKIKVQAYSKSIYPKQPSSSRLDFPFKRLAYSLTPLFIIILVFFFSIAILKKSDSIIYIDSTDLNFVESQGHLNDLVKSSNRKTLSDLYTIDRQTDIIIQDNRNINPIVFNKTTGFNRVDKTMESDIVKYDENYIYAASDNYFRIMEVDKGNVSHIYSEFFDTSFIPHMYNYITNEVNIYQTDNYVILLYQDDNDSFYNTLKIKIFNKNNIKTGNVKAVKEYMIDGSVVTTKLINNNLYIISNYNFNFDAIYEDKDIPLPKINQKEIDLNNVMYMNNTVFGGFSIFTSIILEDEIKFNTNVQLGSKSYNFVYSTNNSLYLIASKYIIDDRFNYTGIVKYDFNHEKGNITFNSSCFVKGYIPNEFSLDEYNGYLRVAVTDPFNGNLINKILVFKEELTNGIKELNLVGKLENIGEKNERIVSVQFDEDEALVVTHFEKPLIKINLSNPTNPVVVEKEEIISGFNSYIYYLTNDIAFGVGYLNKWAGYKFSLYDISKEKIIEEIEFFDSNYTITLEAVTNYQAIYVDQYQGKYLIGFSLRDPVGSNYYLYSVNPNTIAINLANKFTHNNDSMNRLVRISNDNQAYFYIISNYSISTYDRDFQPIHENIEYKNIDPNLK